jgi:hypothetical protein
MRSSRILARKVKDGAQGASVVSQTALRIRNGHQSRRSASRMPSWTRNSRILAAQDSDGVTGAKNV